MASSDASPADVSTQDLLGVPPKATVINAPQSLPTTSGRLVGGKYRLEERLGEGAVGVVYRAVHVGLEKSFAIKLLKTSGPPAPAALARFRREAVVLGRLRHPHIVEVTDFGIDGSEGGLPFIVTELLEGRPLSEVCRDRGPMPLARALPLLGQIAAAVDAAHDAGILHRDLKPGNVFVCSGSPESSSVKVLDFGLAELLEEPEKPSSVTWPDGKEGLPRLTITGLLLGTPLYLAPELVRRGQASRSSDIYSFGVLAYEILSGRPPFQGTLEEVLAGHLEAEPSSLSLPPAVRRPLREALQKDPALRPGSAGEVVRRCLGEGSEAERTRQRSFETPRRWHIPRLGKIWRTFEPRRSFWLLAVLFSFSAALVGALDLMFGRGPVPSTGNEVVGDSRVAENKDSGAVRSVEEQRAAVPFVESKRQPAELPHSKAPAPLLTLGFNDIQHACGDLSSLSNYLCLVNQGSEQIEGGARLVLTQDLASFAAWYSDYLVINVVGKERYSFQFEPPKRKALVPGLYEGAMWQALGPNPGLQVTGGVGPCRSTHGRFRIWQILLKIEHSAQEVRRIVADFEENCGVIGRIAVGDQEPVPPIEFNRPTELPSFAAPMSPGVTLGFKDIERACGDLSSLSNYLCLVNRGNEQIAGGARLVLGEEQASFSSNTSDGNDIWIQVKGKQADILHFIPPKDEAFTPRLYWGQSMFAVNPYPRVTFNHCQGTFFRVLQILMTGRKVQRFVADFETGCETGRISVGVKKSS